MIEWIIGFGILAIIIALLIKNRLKRKKPTRPEDIYKNC